MKIRSSAFEQQVKIRSSAFELLLIIPLPEEHLRHGKEEPCTMKRLLSKCQIGKFRTYTLGNVMILISL